MKKLLKTLQAMKLFSLVILILMGSLSAGAQTSNTGQLTGTVGDTSGALIPDAEVKVTNEATGESRTVRSSSTGNYSVPLLPPGKYTVFIARSGFKSVERKSIQVDVTETQNLALVLEVGSAGEVIEVTTAPSLVSTNSAALGAIVSEREIANLPLVTRNFTQILGLEAGVQMPVTNAAELGRGTGSSTGGKDPVASGAKIAHGARAYDNNFELNGVEVNDAQNTGVSGLFDVSGGIPTPNPDTIAEFKVQTAQYDASFGRNAGAQVNLITKSGANETHGSIWEYFRNEDLNANDWFRKLAGQPRGRLRQNQYGGDIGGHFIKSKLLYFGSYQGTKQSNGVASSCSASVLGPANLTNNRSAAALGAAFAGQTGTNGGTAVLANGSNINPVALQLLQTKLASGAYLIPTPQTTLGTSGFSSFSIPCSYTDSQFLTNLDYIQSQRNFIQGRFFFDNATSAVSFPAGNVPGFTQSTAARYRVGSINDNFTFTPHLVNEATFGIVSSTTRLPATSPVDYQQLAVAAPPPGNVLLNVTITGSYALTSGTNTQSIHQFGYHANDSLSYSRGRHNLRFGGGLIKQDADPNNSIAPDALTFNSFPDFLIGLNGGSTGNNSAFSNVFTSTATLGSTTRNFRNVDYDLYVQDDYKVTDRLSVNLGLRFEYIGPYSDALGHTELVYPNLLNQNPAASGTYAGIVVPANFPGAASLPTGITVAGNNSGGYGGHPYTYDPRIGFAFAETHKAVIRGGFGIFASTAAAQSLFTTSQPFTNRISSSGAANISATFANPYPGVNLNPTFPLFNAYSPTTSLTQSTLDPNNRPGIVQVFSLNQQTELARNVVLEVGYIGSLSQHLLNTRFINAAGFATASTPIRGVTANATNNVASRVPYEGFSASTFIVTQTEARSYYHGLEVTARKRLSNHLQGLAAYTWSKIIDTEGPGTSGSYNTAPPGNPNAHNHTRGLADYDRRHRLVASYLYEFPTSKSSSLLVNTLVNGWQLAGVTTIQTGTALTPVTVNSRNYAGITNDLAQLTSSCQPGHVMTSGGVNTRVSGYFNSACFPAATSLTAAGGAPVVDGTGTTSVTGFGNSGIGTARGPAQDSTDLSLVKRTKVHFPNEASTVEFRTELFNAFNLPQFSNPGVTVSAATFGKITSTSVSARVMQFALRYSF